jgi:hypothetical protein
MMGIVSDRRLAANTMASPVRAYGNLMGATLCRKSGAANITVRYRVRYSAKSPLNTAGALWHLRFGTAAVDAIGPVLLIGWSETGPWLLREINAVCTPTAPEPAANGEPRARQSAAEEPGVIPAGLLARARELDAEHREATGRPISRDTLRARLKIGRDRASALIAAVRSDATATTPTMALQKAA